MQFSAFDEDGTMKAFKVRLASFKEVWPFLEDCNCTPEKVNSQKNMKTKIIFQRNAEIFVPKNS